MRTAQLLHDLLRASHRAHRRHACNSAPVALRPRLSAFGVAFAIASAGLIACGGGGDPVAPPPAPAALLAVTVSPSSAALVAGATVTLSPTPTTAGSGVTVSYSYATSAANVASVSSAGVVTAVAPGTATITVSATGSGNGFTTSTRQTTSSVTVTAAPPALTSLTVSPDSVALLTGNLATLTPTATTGGAGVSVAYAYSSNAPAVATVSGSGAILAVSPGTATITVTATGAGSGFSQTGLEARAEVVVTAPPDALTALSVSPDSIALLTGANATLVPTASTAGSGVTVSYSYTTSAPTVATVSASGVLTAVGPGTAAITVSAAGSGNGFTSNVLQDSSVVIVSPPPALTGLSVTPASVSLVVSNTATLVATANLAGTGSNVTYAYESSATSVATVSNAGIITAVAPGTATIAVTATGIGSGFATTVLEETVAVTVTAIVLGMGFGAEQFAVVSPGTFQMGSMHSFPSERPVHAVTLSNEFLMQKTEVTQSQWRQVMQGTGQENPSWFPNCGATCPVETVSWNDIQLFLQRLNQQDLGKNYRLPTEAEWEYSARAGTTGDYGGTGVLNDMGWYALNSGGRSRPVAQKQANAWGIFDMHGNVAEWVNDRYGDYSDGAKLDPTGPTTGLYRVIRGGDWLNAALYARSTGRSFFTPNARGGLGGFRLVRTP